MCWWYKCESHEVEKKCHHHHQIQTMRPFFNYSILFLIISILYLYVNVVLACISLVLGLIILNLTSIIIYIMGDKVIQNKPINWEGCNSIHDKRRHASYLQGSLANSWYHFVDSDELVGDKVWTIKYVFFFLSILIKSLIKCCFFLFWFFFFYISFHLSHHNPSPTANTFY